MAKKESESGGGGDDDDGMLVAAAGVRLTMMKAELKRTAARLLWAWTKEKRQ